MVARRGHGHTTVRVGQDIREELPELLTEELLADIKATAGKMEPGWFYQITTGHDSPLPGWKINVGMQTNGELVVLSMHPISGEKPHGPSSSWAEVATLDSEEINQMLAATAPQKMDRGQAKKKDSARALPELGPAVPVASTPSLFRGLQNLYNLMKVPDRRQ